MGLRPENYANTSSPQRHWLNRAALRTTIFLQARTSREYPTYLQVGCQLTAYFSQWKQSAEQSKTLFFWGGGGPFCLLFSLFCQQGVGASAWQFVTLKKLNNGVEWMGKEAGGWSVSPMTTCESLGRFGSFLFRFVPVCNSSIWSSLSYHAWVFSSALHCHQAWVHWLCRSGPQCHPYLQHTWPG